MKRKKEYDCQCNYCKYHICNVIDTSDGQKCSDIWCENNEEEKEE